MFYDCFFCGNSIGRDAIETGHLHRIGRNLVCLNCVTDLKSILELDTVEEKEVAK
ncbi:hypothetical protein V7O67_02715 [Methanolobus sp. ZRKC4]|uniref:hypothetical protein n=1 Tax=Methanolobus sp. ZRKC4 TaxID=3125787 RepID=UPI003256410F